MPRYFLEVAYKGAAFHGFQLQNDGGLTVQGEVNRALQILFRQDIQTTTSSRTDAGVHAKQNFLHWDCEHPLPAKTLYALNAIVHPDLCIRNVYRVPADAHARFDATARQYAYHILSFKDPFAHGLSYHYPFTVSLSVLQETAALLLGLRDFSSFSKRNTDAKTFFCAIQESRWEQPNKHTLVYYVRANRFLRGMVKALVGTQLQVGRGRISLNEFSRIIEARDCTLADFSPPSAGLFLENVFYPEGLLNEAFPKGRPDRDFHFLKPPWMRNFARD